MPSRRLARTSLCRSLVAMLVLAAPQIAHADPDELDRLAFFTGCWRAQQGATIIEELWLPPAGGVMVGLSRTVTGGQLEVFEFLRLAHRDGAWHYVAQPNGTPPTWFKLTRLDDDEAVFEDPSHDFPQRILYRRVSADALRAEISGPGDDGREQGFAFDYRRGPCPDSAARHE